jgi:spoIIIJ-associated protein
MQRKQEFICKTLDEGMELAVSYFHLSEEKIFLNILEEDEDGFKVEALVDINLALEGKKYIESILQAMGITYQLEVRSLNNETEIYYNIHTDENPLLIGVKGKTLDALQVLVRNLLQTYSKELVVVNVDVGSYRENRKHQLEVLATKIAKEVAKTKVPVKLKPMSSYERRIIHNKLSEWRDVFTESEGEGTDRCLVIKPKRK